LKKESEILKNVILILTVVLIVFSLVSRKKTDINETTGENTGKVDITITYEINDLENGFSSVKFDKDYAFDKFINNGGVKSDEELVKFLKENVLSNGIDIKGGIFGCSTLAVKNNAGEYIFGRNFDWKKCDALVVISENENYYSSISTVNTDFIKQETGGLYSGLNDEFKTFASMYAPLDGMNEKGLCAAVNMIQDGEIIEQNTDKPDITTTTAVRLLLNKAANVDEAVEILESYDMHSSMGMMIHFALADGSGKSVAVEYIDNEMIVTETPIVTNFYLAEGKKQGIGTQQSHERYEILAKALDENNNMSMRDVANALDSVSKDNFNDVPERKSGRTKSDFCEQSEQKHLTGFESTEWSDVFNQTTKEVWYYHRENYDKCYKFSLLGE